MCRHWPDEERGTASCCSQIGNLKLARGKKGCFVNGFMHTRVGERINVGFVIKWCGAQLRHLDLPRLTYDCNWGQRKAKRPNLVIVPENTNNIIRKEIAATEYQH